jgi:two-component system sensor histidine kinase CreC
VSIAANRPARRATDGVGIGEAALGFGASSGTGQAGRCRHPGNREDTGVLDSCNDLDKRLIDVRVYVTDATGRVILDTDAGRDLGADYSDWRDVALTLQGRYGARSTDGDPLFRDGTTMYVVAPVTLDGKVIGVVSVGKPTRNAGRFLDRLLEDIRIAALLVAAVAGLS